MQNNNNQQTQRIRTNHQIRVPQVRVILSNGDNGGIMVTYEALKLARDEGLDLVEIDSKSNPIVVKIVDFGKMKYEEKKKQQISKKKQSIQELKELTCRPNTDENDFQRLIERARQFLIDNNKVRFIIRFRGREITHQEIGREKLEKAVKDLSNVSSANGSIALEGKFMSLTLSPK
jgi:translation initiation factor IF-3